MSVPLIQDKFVNLQDSRIAAIENDMLFTTNEVVISGTDDHIVHLESHQSKCERVIKGVQDQALSPVDAFKYLENNLLHQSQLIEMLGQDPLLNGRAKEFAERLGMIVKAKDQIRSLAERQMQEQQAASQQPQIDPETQHEMANKDAKAISDQNRKDYVIQSTTTRKDQQMQLSHDERLRQMELDHQVEMEKARNQQQ